MANSIPTSPPDVNGTAKSDIAGLALDALISVAGRFEPVLGFFAQDDPHADPVAIGALPPRFGLLDDSPDAWEKLKQHLASLNENAPAGVKYKLFFLVRHGQGYHNMAYDKYGSEVWEEYVAIFLPSPSDPKREGKEKTIVLTTPIPGSYWAKLTTDGETTWGPDPDLTPKGFEEAQAANKAWKREISNGIPLPQKSYCSPLTRAIQTCMTTFHGILPKSVGKTIVLENLREWHGRNTCDKRRTRSYIQLRFPDLLIEPGMTEEDEMWTNEREPLNEWIARTEKALDQMFSGDETVISVSGHSGNVSTILKVIGRNRYKLPVGGIIPVIVKRTS